MIVARAAAIAAPTSPPSASVLLIDGYVSAEGDVFQRPCDLVAARAPAQLEHWLVDNGYLGSDTPLLKRVAALSWSQVCRDGTTIVIDGKAVAEALERDRLGRPLPVWRGCRTLRDGEVFFLNADHSGSLDGRYFGPLAADTIIGRATPFWTREG